MKSFKRAAGLIAASYLASTAAALDISFHDGQHQVEAPVPHYIRSTLEDLDLAAGRSPFTGKTDAITREVKVTIGPDGKRTITGMSEEEFNRFFETGPDGMPRQRGSGSMFGGMGGGLFGGRTQAGRTVSQPQPQPQPQEEESDGNEDGADAPVRSSFRNQLEGFMKNMGRQSAPQQASKPAEPLKQEATGGSPFRIVVDYNTLNAGISSKHAQYVKNSLMPAVVDYFTGAIKLKYPNKSKITAPNWSNIDTACDGGVPRSYVSQGVDGDLVILARLSNAPNDGYVARAASCVFDSRSGRTVLSSINFNIAHIAVDEGSPLVHAKNIYTTLHELTHVLGFSGVLYENYLLPNGQPNKNVLVEANGMTYVNVEPLTSKLRKHFGCDKIPGAPLENEGGSGSKGAHFERRIFFNEFMTASEVHDGKISEFTLSLLEGTGWYVVDYSKSEPFHPGKGQGCNFFFGACMNNQGKPNFPEFCPREGERLCSASYNGVAICSGRDQFGDGCLMPDVQYRYDCRNPEARRIAELLPEIQSFGPTAGSKCFEGDLVPNGYKASQDSTYCLTYKCNGSGANTTLDIIVGRGVAKCTKKSRVAVTGYSGTIECPDPVDFCSKSETAYCPRGCMGRGTCSNGQCKCNAGFKGIDCSYKA